MTYELTKISGKIAYLEDKLLKSNNTNEIEELRGTLAMLRKTQQRMQREAIMRGEI